MYACELLTAYSEQTEQLLSSYPYTAISRKVVRKKVHATITKGYDQYTVSDTVAVEPVEPVEPAFVSFL